MEEDKPLLEAKNFDENINDKKCISTRMRVMIYVMINSIGLLVSGSAQTQYVYAYVKKNYDFNNTDVSISVYLSNNTETCGNSSSSDDKIQGYATQWNWYISLIEYGICLPVIIIAGPMVDRIGRKPLLLWNTIVMFISFVIKSVVIYYNMNLFYFMIGSGVEGISGTYYAFHLANLAILADTTTKGKDRTWIMTLYDALLGVGAFLSYVGTGYLIQLEGYLCPFVISSGIFLAFFIIIALTLEDTWKRPTTHTKLNIFEIPVQICSLCTVKRNNGVQLNYFLINLFIFLIVMFPLASYSSIRTIYTLGWPFCWTSEHIGWYSAGCDLVIFILGTFILKIMQSFCVLIKDEWIVACGCFSSCVSFILLGFSQTDWMLYVGKFLNYIFARERVRVMVLNATFKIYSKFYCWWKPENLEKTTDLPQVTDKLCHIMLYQVHLVRARFKLTTLVVIGTG